MSTTEAQATVSDFTSGEVGTRTTDQNTIFLAITSRCDIMLGHWCSKPEEITEEIRALRKLAEVAEDVARQLEARQTVIPLPDAALVPPAPYDLPAASLPSPAAQGDAPADLPAAEVLTQDEADEAEAGAR